MDNISSAQLRLVKTLMGKLNMATDDQDAMVRGFTGLRTGHVSEMYLKEGIDLIKHLKTLEPGERSAEKMRKAMIALAYERNGLGRNASKAAKQDAVRQLEAWCLEYGYKRKKLNSYTQAELPKLLSQYKLVMSKLIVEL